MMGEGPRAGPVHDQSLEFARALSTLSPSFLPGVTLSYADG